MTARDDASEWLCSRLARGPVESKQMRKEAEAAGISWSTLKRAKTDLGVRARKREDSWYWEAEVKETTEVW